MSAQWNPAIDEIFNEEFLELAASSEGDRAQLAVLMEAYMIYRERNAVYEDLWKKHGAEDSFHHIRHKAARTEVVLKGKGDVGETVDLINFAAFFIRNMRDGNITGEEEDRD